MRRLAALAALLGVLCLGLAVPAAAATQRGPAPVAAAAAEDHDQAPQDDAGGHGEPKPLATRDILLTLAVIVVAGLAVVLAGLGYFSPDRS